MSEKIIFDFCIIPNPFSNGVKNIIFVAKSGDNFLDENLVFIEEYKDIKKILEKFGYIETNQLQFESLNNSHTNYSIKDLKIFLESFGLNYNRKLEVNIIKGFNDLKKETNKDLQNTELICENSLINKNLKNELIRSGHNIKFKYKEPEISEKITLYFYLFLEFGFNEHGRPIIYLNGDFGSSENYDTRNYIKIVKSDFERVMDPNKPNSIIFSSCKTQKDFLKEAGILYSGFFKYQTNIEKMNSIIIKEKKYPYKLAEVRKFLTPSQSIVIEVNRIGYDTLIELSNKIKKEGVIESRQLISIEDIENKSQKLVNFLNKRIEILSDSESFEEAARFKKDIILINNQLNYIKKMNKSEITTKEYFKIFSIC